MRIWLGTAALLTVTVAGTACGTRLEHDEVVAAAGQRLASAQSESATPAAAAGPEDSASAHPSTEPAGSAADASGSGAATPGARRAAPNGGRTVAGARRATAGSAPKAELVLATLGNYSGVAGSTLADNVTALQIWQKATNAAGGLDGRHIRLIVQDDGSDPARNRALTQQLVERDKVVAFVGNQAPLTAQASVQYLTAKRVPVVGGNYTDTYYTTSPVHFPQASPGDHFFLGMLAAFAAAALPEGKVNLGLLYCSEAASCTTAGRLWGQQAARFGFKKVYQQQASLAQPDFTAECLAARNANVQLLAIALDANSVGRLAASCSRQSYRPLYATVSNILKVNFRSDPNLDGMIVGLPTFPFISTATPTQSTFARAIATYGAGIEPNPSLAEGWTSASLFAKVATGLPDPPTSAAIIDRLYAVNGDDLGGLTQPLRFKPGAAGSLLRTCWSLVRIRSGKFVAGAGGTIHCQD